MGIDMRSADEKQHAQHNTATNTLRYDLDVLQQSAQLLSRWVRVDEDFKPSVHHLKKQEIILLTTLHPITSKDIIGDWNEINFKIKE